MSSEHTIKLVEIDANKQYMAVINSDVEITAGEQILITDVMAKAFPNVKLVVCNHDVELLKVDDLEELQERVKKLEKDVRFYKFRLHTGLSR